MKKWMIALSAATLAITPAALAQTDKAAEKQAEPAKKLAVGDKAPALKVEKFVKGDPIKEFEKGKVYVVEFWATWCGPCVKAFPHLSELQKEYKDKGVTIIGTNIWEDREYSESTLTKVTDFVKKQGDNMAYTVAYDGAGKHMDKAFMQAAGRNGIPSAFIVDKEGKIAWMGHPGQMDKPLEQVVAGKFDSKKAAEDEANAQKSMEEIEGLVENFSTALEKKDFAKASEIGTKLLDGPGKDNPMLMNLVAWSFVDPAAGFDKKDINLDLATKAADRANELTKGKDWQILDTVARVHFVKGDVAKAIELQTKALELTPTEEKEAIAKSLDEYKKAKR